MYIKSAIPNMFHFLDDEAIPKTTNGIEGFFSHLKNHLDIHRGLTTEHRKNFIHAALVEHRDLHTRTDEQGRDVRLQIRKPKHAIGLERQDLVNLGAQECADFGLLVTRTTWAHGVPRNAHNARLFPQQVQPLCCFLGEADNAVREKIKHSSYLGWYCKVAKSPRPGVL